MFAIDTYNVHMDTGNPVKTIAQMITRRASAFTPILVLNATVLIISATVYFRANTLWVFTPSLLLLAYTTYSHEYFARKKPHMLSTEKVQQLGMQIEAGPMGEKNDELPENIVDVMPVSQPGEQINSRQQPKQKGEK
jgi:hypothetical protein